MPAFNKNGRLLLAHNCDGNNDRIHARSVVTGKTRISEKYLGIFSAFYLLVPSCSRAMSSLIELKLNFHMNNLKRMI